MMFGCYGRCLSCKGTGTCVHIWDNTTSKYEGKMWNVSGTKEIPQYHKTWCKNCGAFLLIEFLPSGKEKSRKIDSKNWGW